MDLSGAKPPKWQSNHIHLQSAHKMLQDSLTTGENPFRTCEGGRTKRFRETCWLCESVSETVEERKREKKHLGGG
jgi:hypothetical protein